MTETYTGRRCYYDGTRVRYRGTQKCVECANYARNVAAGRINGIKGTPLIKAAGPQEKWCDEMREEHSQAIKRGQQRKKK